MIKEIERKKNGRNKGKLKNERNKKKGGRKNGDKE